MPKDRRVANLVSARREEPAHIKVHTASVKQFGTVKDGMKYLARVSLNLSPFRLDSRIFYDRQEAEFCRAALLKRASEIELAWPNQSQLDTIFSEAEDEAVKERQTQAQSLDQHLAGADE